MDEKPIEQDRAHRCDGASVHDFAGTCGDDLFAKVSKFVPQLGDRVLSAFGERHTPRGAAPFQPLVATALRLPGNASASVRK